MQVYQMSEQTMDLYTYSNLCRILGKLEGIASGTEDEKIKTALLKVISSLFKLLSDNEEE